MLKKAEAYVKSRQTLEAEKELQKLLSMEPDYGEAHYLLAYTYMMTRRDHQARKEYEEIIRCCGEDIRFSSVYFTLAQYEIRDGHYEKAKEYAENFLAKNKDPRTKREINAANKIIRISDFAIDAKQHPLDIVTHSLGDTVNQLEQQYFPVITADNETLFFTARNAMDDENLYECSWQGDHWSEPTEIKVLNTPYNEGTCSISADGKTIIFTSCERTRERDSYGSCDLFISRKIGGEWGKPQNMGLPVNSRYWESQPALSADGRKLYFVSDRPGGVGRKDIWVSTMDFDGNWSKPDNVGKPINTEGDDLSPFLHANGKTMYFASAGHLGFGGLDLFISEMDSTTWGEPKNLGYPLNDQQEQVSLYITADGKKAYYSKEVARQEDGITRSHITVFDLPSGMELSTPTGFVKGTVYDAKTKQPIKAYLELKELSSDELVSAVFSDPKHGDYLTVIPRGKQYGMYVSRPGYLFKTLSFDYRSQDTEGLEMDIYLDPIEKGKSITLNNIFFEHDSYALLDESKSELDHVVNFLKRNSDLNIEISGHTDNTGDKNHNKQLSMKRAETVVNYLKEHGIPAERMKSIGYGESKPLVPNDSEEHRAKNRRIEFSVI
ncbi:OmpA family protein [Limibacter armeniacum]|uniref:OmpA family protein n=1 Tax=Limibacter armeniacum TaxID=466084 RepID=UPI002FE689B4